MKAAVTEIPDNVSEWPNWLEQQIVGMSLYDLVVGLKAINLPSGARSTLQQLCGKQLPTIYKSGLGVLSTDQLPTLFKTPDLLLELQELVLVEGGAYWDSVEQSAEDKLVVEKHVAKTIAAVGQEKSSVQIKPKSMLEQYWPVLALAAGLLIAIGIGRPAATSGGGGWGFDQSGLLTAQVTGRSYLNSLSDAAGAFSKKVPDSKEAALKRLTEFSAGCKKLIAAPNMQLEKTADRDWLVAKCTDWATKIDGHIAELKEEKKDWQDVLKDANETATKMQATLKDKALQLS